MRVFAGKSVRVFVTKDYNPHELFMIEYLVKTDQIDYYKIMEDENSIVIYLDKQSYIDANKKMI
jgi:hypothetical protein